MIAYRVFGNGYPVVFLHGFLESKTMWESICNEEEFCAILIDLPGHGESGEQLQAAHSMRAMAKEIKRVIDALGIQDYVVVGHSMGGYVGLELIQMDARCQRILLLNSNFWSDSVEKKRDRKRVADIVVTNKTLFLYEAIPNLFVDPNAHDSHVKALIQEASEMSAEAIAACSIAMSKREDHSGWVSENANIITVVQGTADQIVPESLMKEKLGTVDCTYVSIEGTGHMAHLESTELVKNVLGEFIGMKTA